LYSCYINDFGESDGEEETEIDSTTQELLCAMLTFPWDAVDAALLSLMHCFDHAGSQGFRVLQCVFFLGFRDFRITRVFRV
jgi:hypothetical protein